MKTAISNILEKLAPQNWNDVLALGLLFFIIPALWILQGLKILELAGEVIGASIMGWTLVLQYYFRRAPESKAHTTTGDNK
jgi:hypothetical protein